MSGGWRMRGEDLKNARNSRHSAGIDCHHRVTDVAQSAFDLLLCENRLIVFRHVASGL